MCGRKKETFLESLRTGSALSPVKAGVRITDDPVGLSAELLLRGRGLQTDRTSGTLWLQFSRTATSFACRDAKKPKPLKGSDIQGEKKNAERKAIY